MMRSIILGCGYNGFFEITSFLNYSEKNLSIPEAEKDTDPKCQQKNNSINSEVESLPLRLFKIENHQSAKFVFTWGRIAATINNGDGTVKSVITGFMPKKKDKAQNCEGAAEVFDNFTVVAATESSILLKKPGHESPSHILRGNDGELCPLLISGVQKDTSLQHICGGHKEFFVAYDGLNFGKMVESDKHSSKEEESLNSKVTPVAQLQLCPIDSGISVKAVSCGKEHALLLSEHGSVYSCGLGSRGQLGHGDVEAEFSPRLIETFEGVIMTTIAAGGWHSTAVSAFGDLYSWGWNESGQLGLSSLKDRPKSQRRKSGDEGIGIQADPMCIQMPEDVNVSSVSCGSRHTIVLTDKGRAFSCGWNTYGQLGLGHRESKDKLTEVTGLPGSCTQVYAGQWASFFVCNH